MGVMVRRKSLLLGFGIFVGCFLQHSLTVDPSKLPKLIVFSFDGFRNDYVNAKDTPNLYSFATSGVRGHMISTMITKTYPNHQSIVTGLYEPYHGIVNNKFIDPTTKSDFNVDEVSKFWWDMNNVSVPVYVANEYFEPERSSGSMQWPGSWSSYTNGKNVSERRRVHYLQNYDRSMPWEKRIDCVIKWLTDARHPANLVFVYFDEPDSTSHNYGPFSEQVKQQVHRIDDIVGYFREQMTEANLLQRSNIIFLSDHGMSEIRNSSESVFYLKRCEDLYPGLKYEMHGVSPTWSLIPLSKPTSSNATDSSTLEESVRDALNSCSNKLFSGKFRVYLQADIPAQWHYRNNRRILPLFLLTDDATEVFYEPSNWRPKGFPVWGNHGYNNTAESMRPLFIAHGRVFKSSYVHPTQFENVDLYPLMLHLLQIPLDNFKSNGSFSRVREMLDKQLYLDDEEYIRAHSNVGEDSDTSADSLSQVFFVLLYLVGGFVAIMAIGMCFVCTAGFSKETVIKRRKTFEKDRSLMTVLFRRFNRPQPSAYYGTDYRMFHERPTSHLDSSFDDEDVESNVRSTNESRKRMSRRSSQKSLTDIDWDIVGTGLDIDLASELNSGGRNIQRPWHETGGEDGDATVAVLEQRNNFPPASLIENIDDEDEDEDDEDLDFIEFQAHQTLSRHGGEDGDGGGGGGDLSNVLIDI